MALRHRRSRATDGGTDRACRAVLRGLALVLLLAPDAGMGQQPQLPETRVPGFLPPTDETIEPPVSLPDVSPRVFSGSPRTDFDAATSLGTGFPVPQLRLARSVSILDRARLAQQAAVATPEFLEALPGVLIQRTNQGGGSFIVRGRNGNNNLILVDGVPINDAAWRLTNVQYLNTIDPGTIERIEVLRGPASVLYGSGALGGVLNIVTRRRAGPWQEFDLDAGIVSHYRTATETTYGRLEVSGTMPGGGLWAGSSFLTTGSVHAGDGVLFPDPTTGYDQSAADFRLDRQLPGDWLGTFVFQHLFQHEVPRTDQFPGRPTVFDPQQRDFGYFRLASPGAFEGTVERIELTFNVQRRREGNRELRNQRTTERQFFEDVLYWGVDLRGSWPLGFGHTLTCGTTYARDTLDAFRRDGPVGGPFRPGRPTVPDDGDYSQLGVFVLDRFEPTDWLILSAGLRYSNVNADGTTAGRFFDESFDDWSAETGAVLVLTDRWSWVASVSEGFRAPNLEDLGGTDRSTGVGQDFGTPGLAAERVVGYETGIKYRGPWLSGSAACFYNDFENQIVRDPLPGGNNIRLNTTGFLRGVELDLALFLMENWSLFSLGGTAFGHDLDRREPLRLVPPAYLMLGTRWTTPNRRLFLELWTEMADRQDRLSEADRADRRIPAGGTPAWQTLNLRGGLDLARAGRLTLALTNLADQNFRVHGSGVDGPGLDLRLGYALELGGPLAR